MAAAYYNENDPKAAAWLRELIKAGHIASGEVDERSIEDICPADLAGFTQCHFFAGIGGWSYALRLAGWSDDRHVWTGSCPCQPFSVAGKGAGFADERHLWPAWFHLIRECRPGLVFGEQVANALGWFDLVQADLANEGYASGAAIIGAHSVGAPHIRQRLYWVADNNNNRCEVVGRSGLFNGERSAQRDDLDGRGADGDVADSARQQQHGCGDSGRRRRESTDSFQLGDSNREQYKGDRQQPFQPSEAGTFVVAHPQRRTSERHGYELAEAPRGMQGANGQRERLRSDPWDGCEFIPCTDGKARPVEPGTFPLADGIPNRVGLLRGYGNAIVPQVAAAFITSFLESTSTTETLQ